MKHTLLRAAPALLLAAFVSAPAAELTVTVEIPQLEVAEYHRPYVGVWVERADQTVAASLAVWYDVAGRDGAHWLPDLRQWWRRSGRTQQLPIDAVTGATRPAGRHELKFAAGRVPLGDLPPGNYMLVVEAVREAGGREALRVPFGWPAAADETVTAEGVTEIGEVTLTFEP